jgi:hypothetical protein
LYSHQEYAFPNDRYLCLPFVPAVCSSCEFTGTVLPDKQPPVIEGTSYPSSVVAGTTFTIYLTMTDRSGVMTGQYSYMNVRPSKTSDSTYLACSTTDLVLQNGTIYDGTWALSCIIPVEAPNYSYDLEIHISDVESNQAELNVANAFMLTGGSEPDHKPPVISQAHYADDVLNWGDTLVIYAHISDAQTGIKSVKFQANDPYSTYIIICSGDMVLTGGNDVSGDYEYSCVIPSGADNTYYLGSIYAYDGQNNVGFTTLSFKVNPSFK